MRVTTLTGTVTKFKGNGRKLGYPTANFRTTTSLKEGVYFGFADLAMYHKKPALIFIGVPSTIGDSEYRIEVHVLDIPDIDYYDQTISVATSHFHRSNQTFDTLEQLLSIMHDDEAKARAWFKDHQSPEESGVG